MNGLRRIELVELPYDFPEHLIEFARPSDPLLLGTISGDTVCIIGMVPPTIISDTAYIWGWTTPMITSHRVIYARWSHWLIAEALKRYPTLVGHCHRDRWRWVRSLGAELVEVDGDMFQFRICA